VTELLENRRSRASFTRVLERFCARLDETSVFHVMVPKRDFLPGYSGKIRIRSLAVVGSYARGSPTCGDLDLLLDLEVIEGSIPPIQKLVRQAFGVFPDVRYYHGSQEENSSGIAFGESVCIWREGADWKQNLSSIKEDPQATAPRRSDTVPLRIEQTEGDLTERRKLTELVENGTLRWRLIPYEGGSIPDELNEAQARVLHVAKCSWGRRSRALLPDILRYLRTRFESSVWNDSSSDLDMAGVVFQLGYSSPHLAVLETPTHARIVIAPHISRRGPNALWEIERGDAHPLEVAFAHRECYVLRDTDEKPSIGTEVVSGWGNEAAFLELFPTFQAALKWQDYLCSNAGPEDAFGENIPVLYRGRQLLDLLSYADIVEFIDEELNFASHYLTPCAIRVRAPHEPENTLKIASTEELLASMRSGNR
jgi:hypothetical protein